MFNSMPILLGNLRTIQLCALISFLIGKMFGVFSIVSLFVVFVKPVWYVFAVANCVLYVLFICLTIFLCIVDWLRNNKDSATDYVNNINRQADF
jgi:hypothetical protein